MDIDVRQLLIEVYLTLLLDTNELGTKIDIDFKNFFYFGFSGCLHKSVCNCLNTKLSSIQNEPSLPSPFIKYCWHTLCKLCKLMKVHLGIYKTHHKPFTTLLPS